MDATAPVARLDWPPVAPNGGVSWPDGTVVSACGPIRPARAPNGDKGTVYPPLSTEYDLPVVPPSCRLRPVARPFWPDWPAGQRRRLCEWGTYPHGDAGARRMSACAPRGGL